MRKLGVLLLCLLALPSCRQEPDFDERYDAANEKIHKTAAEIDAEIAGTATADPDDAPEN